MAALLHQWLATDVGLSRNVTSFEADFANGYYFGEVLSRFNQQPDFADFTNNDKSDTKVGSPPPLCLPFTPARLGCA